MNLCVVDVTPSYSIQANMQLTRTKTPSWIHSLRRHRSCLTFASAGQPGTSTVQDCRVVTRIGYSVIFRLVWWRSRVFMPVVNTCFYCRGWCFRLVPTASTEKIFHVRSCIQTTYCEDGCLCKVICYQIAQIVMPYSNWRTGDSCDLLCTGGCLDLVRGSLTCTTEEALEGWCLAVCPAWLSSKVSCWHLHTQFSKYGIDNEAWKSPASR